MKETKLYNTSTLPKSDYILSKDYNSNMIINSFINTTDNVYGGEIRTFNLVAGYNYTLSVSARCSIGLINFYNTWGVYGYMRVVLLKDEFSKEIIIKSSVDEIGSVTFTAPVTGKYYIATYQDSNSNTGNYHINWYKVEVGSQSTPYIQTEYLPVVKKYIIDTTTFDGYNGKLLSDKNLELIFTDPKSYKRKATKNITFFD